MCHTQMNCQAVGSARTLTTCIRRSAMACKTEIIAFNSLGNDGSAVLGARDGRGGSFLGYFRRISEWDSFETILACFMMDIISLV